MWDLRQQGLEYSVVGGAQYWKSQAVAVKKKSALMQVTLAPSLLGSLKRQAIASQLAGFLTHALVIPD